MPVLDPITLGHNAVTARLREKLPANRWAIEPIAWPMTGKEFERLMKATPWIGIAFEGFKPADRTGRRLVGAVTFRIVLCVKNPDTSARYLGDARGPGLYPSLMLAAALLHGHSVKGFGTFFAGALASAYADGFGDMAIGIGTIELTMLVDLHDVLADGVAVDRFASLAAAWDLLPGDGEPTDIIEFPEET